MIALAVAAAVVSWLIGALIRRHAARIGLLDIPNERSSHVRPTPRGGGAGIVLASIGGMLLLDVVGLALSRRELLALVAGGGFVALVSFIDDRRGLPAALRLAVHVAVAAFAVWLLGAFDALALDGYRVAIPGAVGLVLTTLWIVGLTNAYNFMDGTDGLAASQAIVAALTAGWIAASLGRSDLVAVALLIALASAGFLAHNWSPARLFMGDVGSAFLGYSLAVLTIAIARQDARAAATMAFALWPFLLDPLITLARRAVRGENLMQAHRSHLYQRLVARGWRHDQVCVLYTALAAAGALAGLALSART